jgi:hypothetical protein
MSVCKCNGPLGTSLNRTALHKKDRIVGGVKGLGKLLQVIIWHLRSLLGPQPNENPREHTTNQLECWGYTKRVYQQRSPKPASPGGPSGWYGGLPTGRPSCWKYHGGTGCRSLWRIQRQAHGGLPCSTRIGLSLGLQFISAPVPSCSPRQRLYKPAWGSP